MLSVLPRLTACDYLFGIFWSLCCLSFLDLRLVITSLVSFGHCVVCPSSTYGLWLPLWYLLVIVLSVLPRLTACDYLFGIFWSLCCLSFLDLRLVITSLVSFGHCVVCPSSTYGLWLHLFGVFWSLCCLFDLRLVITSLVSFGHCVVFRLSSTYGLWLPLWYLLVIVLSVLPRLTAFVITASLVSFGHCVVCPSSTYGLWLPLWYLLVIVLSVLPRLTACNYLFGIFWSLCCLSFLDLRLVITSLVSFGHCVVCPSSTYGLWLPLWYLLVIVLSVLPRLTACNYLFGIFWSLCCLSFSTYACNYLFGIFWSLCCLPSSTYGLWLPLWYLLVIVLSVLPRLTACDYLFGIFWSLCCLSFLDLRLVVTSLVSFGHCVLLGHCVVCPSSTYGLWLPLWYLLVIVLSVLPRLTACDYLFGIFWSLCCLSFLDLRLVITSLVSFGHCVVCPSSTYGLWLPLWYLLVIVLSVLPRLTACDYLFGIFWSLCCLSFLDLRLVVTSLVSFGHCVVCPSSTYGLWLPLWYLLVIVLSVLPRLTACDYLFGIFWSLCCLSFLDLRLVITSLVSFGHCVVCPSSTYGL